MDDRRAEILAWAECYIFNSCKCVALFPARAAHEDRADALGGVPGDRPRTLRRLIVRMGMDAQQAQRVPVPNLVILAGLVCILVSICWRIARAVL